ncbi:Ubiquitin-conjugating enzyme [Geosmithia morbida]|uniref:Ubiquitin-conjugating enzyme n=1 Tax=Geosmithia morbida TaxID=1094350 RepID=A0A9P4Z3F6_9HYPO|nr:Ubiquitin-conjugating enzyme [Geosmithia morbida]KAF4126742.1 Ubiquitin-conjugating enzyme [Geosmithia morbida]
MPSLSAGLKQTCPGGVFVSLTPGDPTLWSAVLFVRNGPYSPAVLRFHIQFPHKYPALPPVVTFDTDMFHPLITPLTTFMYTTDIQNNGTVSATDGERLPPGSFSLRHGFPQWFGRGSRGVKATVPRDSPNPAQLTGQARMITPEPSAASGAAASYSTTDTVDTSAYDILRYIKSAFGDEAVLDSIPIDAAGNPGAWHAWRTHRRKHGKMFDEDKELPPPPPPPKAGDEEESTDSQEEKHLPRLPPIPQASVTGGRRPDEWDWEGVWEDRVKKGINASLSEPALYGGTAALPDDLIHFLPLEQGEVESVKENIRRSLGEAAI